MLVVLGNKQIAKSKLDELYCREHGQVVKGILYIGNAKIYVFKFVISRKRGYFGRSIMVHEFSLLVLKSNHDFMITPVEIQGKYLHIPKMCGTINSEVSPTFCKSPNLDLFRYFLE